MTDPDLAALARRAQTILAKEPNNIETLRQLAHVAATNDSPEEAERLLREAITLAPNFVAAHADLASLLCRLGRAEEAVALLDDAIAGHPGEVWPLSLKAAVFSAERRAEEALAAHRAVLTLASHATVPWMNYAHALKTVGDTEEAILAYRKALELDPANGSSWWGLANLRTIRFDAADIALMDKALGEYAHNLLQQVHLHFALGKGLGDIGNYERSFRHYEEANRLRGELIPYDAGSTSDFVDRSRAMFPSDFFADRSGLGCDARDVIFILGMPRSGSTLVEQILASHPLIEGCGELFELQDIARHIMPQGVAKVTMPEAIARLGVDDLRAIGQRYLQSARRHRRTDRPFFTDKMPSNWQWAPLIHLILPHAKIIDVRRHPLACCFSSFTTYFNAQTSFPTNLTDLARYHADYTRLMTHLDAHLPGRIHRLDYEKLVEDVEAETRCLLAYLDLPFDRDCLRFHENPRAIHTPSAQQVREPINKGGLDRWQNYKPWLTPLEEGVNQ